MAKSTVVLLTAMIVFTFTALGSWLFINAKSSEALRACRVDLAHSTDEIGTRDKVVKECERHLAESKTEIARQRDALAEHEKETRQQREVERAARSATIAKSESEWVTLASFKGSGIKNTESFSAPSKEWRLSWRATGSDVFFSVAVYDAAKNEVLSLPVMHTGSGSDVSYVRGGSGRYFLEINSTASWEIIAEYKREG